MMYASRTSFRAGAELLNCRCMLASRCCGREAILKDVRSAAEDMAMAQVIIEGLRTECKTALPSRNGLSHGGDVPLNLSAHIPRIVERALSRGATAAARYRPA